MTISNLPLRCRPASAKVKVALSALAIFDLARETTLVSKARRKRAPQARASDNRSVEALTVGWMLCVLTTLVCELGLAAARIYLLAVNPDARWIAALAAMLLFAAAVVGLISLLLAWAVVKIRREPPPRGVLVFALVIGAAALGDDASAGRVVGAGRCRLASLGPCSHPPRPSLRSETCHPMDHCSQTLAHRVR